MHRRIRRKRRVPIGLMVGISLVLAGGAVLFDHQQEQHAYARLTSLVTEPHAQPADDAQPAKGTDWQSLRAINQDVAAWVRVENTDVDLPVVAPSDKDMDFYLTHDLWRNQSLGGVPFLDHRCDADGTHRMVFGHHLDMGGQFSSLQRVSEQSSFDRLGRCLWQTPAHGTTTLRPFCAFEADMWCEPIQVFAFASSEELRTWLAAIGKDASARAAGWEGLARRARSAVTLVTCSSDLPHERWRTFAVFVEAADEDGRQATTPRDQDARPPNRSSSSPLRASLSHAT